MSAYFQNNDSTGEIDQVFSSHNHVTSSTTGLDLKKMNSYSEMMSQYPTINPYHYGNTRYQSYDGESVGQGEIVFKAFCNSGVICYEKYRISHFIGSGGLSEFTPSQGTTNVILIPIDDYDEPYQNKKFLELPVSQVNTFSISLLKAFEELNCRLRSRDENFVKREIDRKRELLKRLKFELDDHEDELFQLEYERPQVLWRLSVIIDDIKREMEKEKSNREWEEWEEWEEYGEDNE